jgi:hypothetical protein
MIEQKKGRETPRNGCTDVTEQRWGWKDGANDERRRGTRKRERKRQRETEREREREKERKRARCLIGIRGNAVHRHPC